VIHGVILSVLAGLALVAYLARRKPKATHVVICDEPQPRARPPKRKKRK
jgi:hypothetical protein